jgi:hypothetical protein
VLFDQTVFLQGLQKFIYIAFRAVTANAKLSNDLIDDLWLAGPTFKKFKDSRSDEVEVEHLAVPNIQDNGTILSVRAADAF